MLGEEANKDELGECFNLEKAPLDAVWCKISKFALKSIACGLVLHGSPVTSNYSLFS